MAKKKMSEKADKRRRAKVVVGHDPDGKAIIKYASGRTQKELDAAKAELIRTYINGATSPVQREVLFGEYAQQWYETYKRPDLSISSRTSYATTMNKHILPVFGDRQLRSITAIDLQSFLNSKASMKPTSLGYITTVLHGVFDLASAQGIIDRNPASALKKPKTEKETRRALTENERVAALKVGVEHPEGLLLLVLYYTGLRIGEALGLQWQDVDFQARNIHVRRDIDFKTNEIGTLKSKAAYRDVPMPKALSDALNAVRGVGTTFVIQSPREHTHLTHSTCVRRWRRLMIAMAEAAPDIEKTKIKTEADSDIKKEKDEKQVYASVLTAHYFRHNYASLLYDADVDILSAQRFLGHADVKTTLAIYAHLSKGKEDSNAEKVRDIFSKVAERLPKPKTETQK